jgi:hypothetical protein
VPNSTGLTCVDALDQYVDELGELISVRAHSENEELIAQLPPLIMGEEIRYCHQQAQAIDFFIVEKQGVVRESMSSLEGEFRFTTGREVEHCLLLVTLNNGVQYWDGVLPAPSVH